MQLTSNSNRYLSIMLILLYLIWLAVSMQIIIPKTKVQSNRQWTRISLVVEGGQQPYEHFYDRHPQGWNQVFNYIYVPNQDKEPSIYRKFPARVRIKDARGQEIKTTVVFIASAGNLYASAITFPYQQEFDEDFYFDSIFSGQPKLVQSITVPKSQNVTQKNISQQITPKQKAPLIIKKVESVAETPGAGLTQIMKQISSTNDVILVPRADSVGQLVKKIQETVSNNNENASIISNNIKSSQSGSHNILQTIHQLIKDNKNAPSLISSQQILPLTAQEISTNDSSELKTTNITNAILNSNRSDSISTIKIDNNTNTKTNTNIAQNKTANNTNSSLLNSSTTTANNISIASNITTNKTIQVANTTLINASIVLPTGISSSIIANNTTNTTNTTNITDTTNTTIVSGISNTSNISITGNTSKTNNVSAISNATNIQSTNSTATNIMAAVNNLTASSSNNSTLTNTFPPTNVSANISTNASNSSTVQPARQTPSAQQFIRPSISTPVSIYTPPPTPLIQSNYLLDSLISPTTASISTPPVPATYPIPAPTANISGVPVAGIAVSGYSSNGQPATVISTPVVSPPNTNTQKQFALLNAVVAANQEITQQKSIEQIFFKLPGSQQLDAIILQADSVALMRIIQRVIASQLTCEQKQSYLSDLLGRIQSAINMKAFAAMQLGVIAEGTTIQIDRLNQKIKDTEDAIAKLGLKDLRDKLQSTLKALDTSYNKFNQADLQIPPKQAKIIALKKQNEILQTTADTNRQALPMQRIQLNAINQTIIDLEQKLQQAKERRIIFQSNINALQTSIKSHDEKIKEKRKRIDDLQIQIAKRQQQASLLKNKHKALQIQVETQRNQIIKRQKKIAEIAAQVPSLQQMALVQRSKINTAQLDKLRALVSQLKTVQPMLQSKIDQGNFKCNKISQVKPVRQTGSQPRVQGQSQTKSLVQIPKMQINNQSSPSPSSSSTSAPLLYTTGTSYQLPLKEYLSYISSVYSIKVDQPNLQQNIPITVTPLNILDPQWTFYFGSPYSAQSYVRTTQFLFQEDFDCMKGIVIAGYGKISHIARRVIQVTLINNNANGKDKPNVVNLNLGACSRLDAIGVPTIGQKIFYRGAIVSDDTVNLHRASCL